MKTINFINTISADRHKELTRWAQITITLFIAACIGIALVTTHKLLTLNALKKEQHTTAQTTDAYASMIKKNEDLKKQELALKEKLTLLSEWNDTTTQSAKLLQTIQKTVSPSGTIESIALQNKKMTLIVLCRQAGDAMQMIQSLKAIPEIEELALVSLQPKRYKDQAMVHITLKGTLKI